LFRGLTNATVYLDSGSLFALNWTSPGGLAGFLLERSGASCLKKLNENETDSADLDSEFDALKPPETRRVAFILSSPIPVYLAQIRRLLLSHAWDACLVLSGVSEGAHAALAELPYPRDKSEEDTGVEPNDVVNFWNEARNAGGQWERDAGDAYFSGVETRLARWMLEGRSDDEEPDVSVLHFPAATFANITDRLFLLPNAHLFPLLDPARFLSSTDPKLGNLSPSLQRRVTLTASSLSDFLDALGVQDHVYSAGATSDLVARVLTSRFATTTRRRASKTASLVLVDKTMDLLPAVSHSENLFDQIVRAFGGLDVAVPTDLTSFPEKLPLSHSLEPGKLSVLSSFLSHPARENLARLRKKLADATGSGKMPVKVTAAQISRLLASFKGDEELLMKHAGAVEIGAVVERALHAGNEEAQAAEKILLLALEQGDEDAAEQAVEQWRSLLPDSAASLESATRFRTAVGLLINLWMRLQETRAVVPLVRDALLKCLLTDPPAESDEEGEFDAEWGWGDDSTPPSPVREKPDKDTEDRYREWKERKRMLEDEVDVFVGRLEALRRSQSQDTTEKEPLVAKIVSELCQPKSPTSNALSSALGSWLKTEEESSLKHHSYGLLNYAASSVAGGLSGVLRTVQTAAKKTIDPFGNKVLIVFVLGGITGTEVQASVAAWEGSRGGVEELIIGSGGMIGPEEVVQRLAGELLR
jgi:hypothetical protein